MPKVSVIVPTYNRGYIVKQAINSILAQTVSDIEVLVVDDGSTDDTKQVVELIKDARIKYFYKENGGVSSARNFGMVRANSEYVAFLDSDDIWPADFLKLLTESLDENADFGLAYTATILKFPDGREKPDDVSRCVSGQITAHLFKHGTIWPTSILIRRLILKDFWFDEKLKVCEDSDAFLRLSLNTKFMFVPDVKVIRRSSEDSVQKGTYTEGACLKILSLERFYYQLGGNELVSQKLANKKLSHCYRRAGERYVKEGYRSAAICLLKRAIKYKPSDIRLYMALIRAGLCNKAKDKNPDWQMPKSLGALYSASFSVPKGN